MEYSLSLSLCSFGLWIGGNPYKTILGSLLFCAVCSSGMLTWYTLTDDEYLWTPYGSEVGTITYYSTYTLHIGNSTYSISYHSTITRPKNKVCKT